YFPTEGDAFSPELVKAICEEADLPGILGNCHASGTEIIARFGEEHIRSGKPICYTSSDSVFQIAAHETHFGLGRLIALCETVRKLLDPLNIGR
ncbi:phosphopentomutase, partial [bacterium M00.F.Ca.ET.156.01.1.1]